MIPNISVSSVGDEFMLSEVASITCSLAKLTHAFDLTFWVAKPEKIGLPPDMERVTLHFEKATWAALKAYVDTLVATHEQEEP